MIRNLKVMGIALVAVFALSAVVASAASAALGVLTSSGPVTLKSTETGAAGSNAFTAFGGKTECPGTVLTGHKFNKSSEPIEPGANSFTITPDYGPCKTTLGSLENAPTTIDMGTCDFSFQIGETTGGVSGTYGVIGKEVCSSGHIQVTIFSSSAHSLRLCTLTTEAPAEGFTGPHLTNTGETPGGTPDDFDINGTFGNFKVVKSGLCGAQTTEEGKLDIDATLLGFNVTQNPTGVTISHN
jgi:hypothetical protein